MRLRKPCEHGRYEAHKWTRRHNCSELTYCEEVHTCPGGEFLADDALVIEKMDGEWPEWATLVLEASPFTVKHLSEYGGDILDALTVREGAR